MSFSPQDPEPPLIPPKRSSAGSNGHSPQMANGNSSKDSLKIFQEAAKFNFYHGKLEGKQVEKILRDHLQIKGSYLLRKSNRNHDALTFSVVHTANHIYHFNVFWKKGKFTVTEALMFATLSKLIAHFETHEIPGNGTPGLFLQHPIACANQAATNGHPKRSSPLTFRSPKPKSPSASPQSSPKTAKGGGFFARLTTPPASPKQVRKRDISVDLPSPVADIRQNAPPPDPADRPPMPIPREPIYDSRRHQYDIYSVPDNPDRDRFYDIRALCHRADLEIAKQSKKCTCGLYLYESTLVDNWMMHRDIENTATKGKIFFVNTATNEATWQLPNQIRRKMETTDAEKWKRINAVLQSENAKT